MMKKKYMLIAVLCVSMLAGCGTNDEKNTELPVKSENRVTADTEVTPDESKGEVTEAEQAESDETNTDGQTSSGFYAVATSKSAEEVEAFAANIRNFIINKDWNALAEEMQYPLTVDGSTVENSSDFLALDLDGKLNQTFVDTIESESCKEMFCNYQGIMLGQGEVWIADVQNENGDFELKVFAINGMLEQ